VLAALVLWAALTVSVARAADPAAALAPLLGTPYRNDGATDPAGKFTLFADPATVFTSPGLNCSGFVVTACRKLLGRPLPLAAIVRDRKGDSGPNSARGQDWDFGYDLICNITDGLPRRVLLPDGAAPDPDAADAAKLRGFVLHDGAAWAAVLPRIRPGELVLAAFSKDRGGRLLFYHVGLIFADEKGHIWLYHATPGTGAHRLDLASPAGKAALAREFGKADDKRILLVSVPLPR
jgi:cell wall-associated NlpC family hydrolase